MNEITVRSVLLNPYQNDKPLTPAMVLALWVIADAVDKLKLSDGYDSPVELTIPTAKLRNSETRSNNVWLRTCLDRLTGLKIGGNYRGNDWGAVILAEWRIEKAGAQARLFLPPSSVHALRSGDTFAKIEMQAAYRLQGHARILYGALADKKRLGQRHWIYDLDELRSILNVSDKKAYQRFNNLRFRVLDPAVDQINDFGTVSVKMTPMKVGRSIEAVRFDWEWKTLCEARETDEENNRLLIARRKGEETRDAPPLMEKAANDTKQDDVEDYLERKRQADEIMKAAGFKR